MNITPEIVAAHHLTTEEFARIEELLGRAPTFAELGIFSVMWSEHCSYKSSRIHLKKLPTTGERVIVPPGENAGVVDVGDGWCAAFKVESHNHPSFIEPFQGAATGVGGILRDIFTMGARPVAAMNSLRFGFLDNEANGRRNQRLLAGVVAGIAHYGNAFGVATIGGEVMFDDAYALNPLVNAFALGLVRHDAIFFGTATGINNPVLYVGAKTGRDGIHGATMASAEFDNEALDDLNGHRRRSTVRVIRYLHGILERPGSRARRQAPGHQQTRSCSRAGRPSHAPLHPPCALDRQAGAGAGAVRCAAGHGRGVRRAGCGDLGGRGGSSRRGVCARQCGDCRAGAPPPPLPRRPTVPSAALPVVLGSVRFLGPVPGPISIYPDPERFHRAGKMKPQPCSGRCIQHELPNLTVFHGNPLLGMLGPSGAGTSPARAFSRYCLTPVSRALPGGSCVHATLQGLFRLRLFPGGPR